MSAKELIEQVASGESVSNVLSEAAHPNARDIKLSIKDANRALSHLEDELTKLAELYTDSDKPSMAWDDAADKVEDLGEKEIEKIRKVLKGLKT